MSEKPFTKFTGLLFPHGQGSKQANLDEQLYPDRKWNCYA